MSDYPEHDKLSEVQQKSQAIGEFLEALSERNIVLCQYQELRKEHYGDGPDDYIYAPSGYYPTGVPIQKRLAEYFGIDLERIDAEKREMLDAIRSHADTSEEWLTSPA